ncbi:MAG: polysaccharide deacetylase family protein [Alphaproteobacteria bacterium]|nr:polysaccharide deacetylase family protein [Alphaproteobacteria bacterium]
MAALACAAVPARASDAAVVLAYPRLGPGRSTATVTIEQFEAHIKELKSGPYTVLPLGDIVRAMREGKPLPDRSVALTFDSGLRSIYRDAWPRLKAAGLPFTVFAPTDRIAAGNADYMSWDELRQMAQAGVGIGSQGAGDLRLATTPLDRAEADIQRSMDKLRAELGAAWTQRPLLFAYPYGEWTRVAAHALERFGFAAAFGQHSGVAHASLGMFALPRFALSQSYGDPDRFRIAVNALPLPLRELVPGDPIVRDNPPSLGFTVDPVVGRLDQLSCFASEQGRAIVEVLGEVRVEVRMPGAFSPGRARVNCTMPGPDGRWRWLGVPFFVPEP